jgi:hypothetical protein
MSTENREAGFIGRASAPPEILLDFGKQLFLVEFVGAEIAMVTVNANSHEEAIAKAVGQLRNCAGEIPAFDLVRTGELLMLEGGANG